VKSSQVDSRLKLFDNATFGVDLSHRSNQIAQSPPHGDHGQER
jgi:hypothetical protein